MPSNKDRLYLALYARAGAAKMAGKEDTYHWELLVGPKSDKIEDEGVRYHARECMKQDGNSEWEFEEVSTTMLPSRMIMVRILVAKIESRDRLAQLLRHIPIRQGQKGWNCVAWIKEALEQLQISTNGIGTSVVEWEAVRNAAMSYVQNKKDQHRFDGKGSFAHLIRRSNLRYDRHRVVSQAARSLSHQLCSNVVSSPLQLDLTC